ncbi:TPM domain-containing protein [Vagococcus sp.]|uniref:TPM domain-containing protein n=1 Tax=Vagococcus sp. TaxID=1933889 RepID=UPI003F984A9C
MTVKKMNLFFIILLSGVFLFASPTFAQTPAETDNRIFDEATLLSTEQKDELNDKIKDLQKEFKIDIVLLTTNDTQGQETKMFAADFYDYGGFGFNETKDGVIFIINMQAREFYFVTTGHPIAVFSDRRIKKITDQLTEPMLEENYFETFNLLLSLVQDYSLKGAPKGYRYNSKTGQVETYRYLSATKIIVALIGGIVVAFVFVTIIIRRYQLKDPDYHYDYLAQSEVEFQVHQDILTSNIITTRHIPKNNGGSGSNMGGGSSTFTGSSGTSHGGGGGSF